MAATTVERDEFDELEDESWDVEPEANATSDVTFQVTVDRAKVADHLGKSLEYADRLATVDETIVDHIKLDDDNQEDMDVGEFFDPHNMPSTMQNVDSDGNRPVMRPPMHRYTGLDMTGEDIGDPAVRENRKKRAARFGIEETSDVDISSGVVNDLRAEFGIDPSNELHKSRYRLDTLHVCGVSQMSTFDITQHFAAYMPETVEWIDDQKCNVVCRDVDWASRCLLAMTKTLKRVRSTAVEEGEVDDDAEEVVRVKQEDAPSETLEPSPTPITRHAVKVEPTTAADVDEGIEMDVAATTTTDTTSKTPAVKRPVAKVCDKHIEVDVEQTDVPPGRWRVVVTPHKRSTVLLMRYANVRDVKAQGAQHRSEYYAQYGNPNYAPMHGLLSRGMRERLKAMRGGANGDLRNRVLGGESLRPSNDPFTQRHKVRPGLNMFDDDGNELEWDWEHDTRFYDDRDDDGGGGDGRMRCTLLRWHHRLAASVVSPRKRARDVDGAGAEKRMRMDEPVEEVVDEKPSRASVKARLGGRATTKSLLDTVHWRQLPFNDDETLCVTKSVHTGERTATTGHADWSGHDDRLTNERAPVDEDDEEEGGVADMYGQVGREQDDELAGAVWHVGAPKTTASESMLARVDPESAANKWTAPDDVRRMRVTIDNEHAEKVAARPSVHKSVRDRLGREKTKTDSGRIEKKKEHKSKHRREREKKSRRSKTSIMLRDDKKHSSKSSKKSNKSRRRHASSSSSSDSSSSSSESD